MKFHFNANGELICAGFSADSTTDFVSGSYFVKIDTKTKEVTYAKESNFGLEKPLYQYSFKQIISKGEDGYILLGEYYEFGMYSVNNGNSSSTKIKYSFGNILIVDIDNAGNVRWKTEIPKFQSSTNNQGIYSSFGAMAFDDHIKIIYNDHIDNFTENARKTGPKKNVSIKKNKGVVVQANVSFDGKVTQKKLFTFDELDVILFPKMFLRIDAENMLMYGGGKGATQFGIMTF